MLNLDVEMFKAGINDVDIQKTLKCSRKTAYNKRIGKTAYSVKDALTIKSTFFPNKEIEYLFAEAADGDKPA